MKQNIKFTVVSICSFVLLISILSANPTHASLFGDIVSPFRALYNKGISLTNRILGNNNYNNNYNYDYNNNDNNGLRGSSASDSRQDDRIISGRGIPPPAQAFVEPNSVQSSGDEEDENSSSSNEDPYKARCFFWRKPNLKQSPKLIFFSKKNHSNETRGCRVDVEIPLNTTDNIQEEDVDSSDKSIDPQLNIDTRWIQTELIDSGEYNGNYPTFILIHGFLSSWNGDNWMCKAKDLILDKAPANVFILDWSGGAKPMLPIDYSAAVSNTKYIAQILAEFLNTILLPMSNQNDARQFHLIGHSLGAHICGFVGYSVNNVGYITGLDPAGPCFSSEKSKNERIQASESGQLDHGKRRLSPDSANFVLALHTDTALFGLNENCAHYDVYINGGYKQPYCGSTSIKSRFNDLLDLNFNDSLNLNIVCAHSFAHELLDTFVTFVTRRRGNRLQRQDSGESPDEQRRKCYAMAYQCTNWASFKSGECGFCLEGDTHCLYTGLSLIEDQPKKLAEDENLAIAANKTATISDDDKFNDEEGDGDNPGDHKPGNPDGDDKFVPSEVNSRGQHFMKAAGSSSRTGSCLYHYQIIIASRKSTVAKVSGAEKHFYYLDIPLESSGQLNDQDGNRLHDRLVQISHKIEQDSDTHNFLKSTYLHALRSQNPSIKFESDDIEFYTALITFKQAPEDECKDSDDNDGATKSQKWQLCRPLDNIKMARLWSSSEMKLNAVQWVSMNYMSTLHYTDRMSNSWVFDRDLSEGLKSRNELDESNRAQIGNLAPNQPKTTGNSIRKPVGCLLSYLDSSDSATRNFKCKRSANELKFAIKLNALKQKAL